MEFEVDTNERFEKKDYDSFCRAYEDRRLFIMELRDTNTDALLGKYRPVQVEGLEWTKASAQHVCLQKMKVKQVHLVSL